MPPCRFGNLEMQSIVQDSARVRSSTMHPVMAPCSGLRALRRAFQPAEPMRTQRVEQRQVAVNALESYMVDKLQATEMTFKEMQLRMADPEVAADASEFQRVAKAAADIEDVVSAYRWVGHTRYPFMFLELRTRHACR